VRYCLWSRGRLIGYTDIEERNESEMFGSGWPPAPPEDPRWDSMQYHLQVYLEGRFDDDASSESEDL